MSEWEPFLWLGMTVANFQGNILCSANNQVEKVN